MDALKVRVKGLRRLCYGLLHTSVPRHIGGPGWVPERKAALDAWIDRELEIIEAILGSVTPAQPQEERSEK
jgi:hypothetical protein